MTGEAKTHPPALEMIKKALESNEDRKGASLRAIKSFIKLNYKVDDHYMSVFIKKSMHTGIENGSIVTVSGNGLSGRFKAKKEATARKATTKAKAPAATKTSAGPPKVKILAAKKTSLPKKKTTLPAGGKKIAKTPVAAVKKEATPRGAPRDRSVVQERRKKVASKKMAKKVADTV